MSYSIAILADIHGNVAALDAVLADLEQHAPDQIVLAGDLVMNGPQPATTMQRIHSLQLPSVMGNMDMETLKAQDTVAIWTAQQLQAQDMAYLQALPRMLRFAAPGVPNNDHDLLIMHATPRDCYDILILEPHPLTTFTEPTPLPEARAMLADEQAQLMVYGHIHYCSQGLIDGQELRSIGSVGFPFDGDQQAAYAITTWDTEQQRWHVRDYRVAYDAERVAVDLEQSDIPFAARYARMIREARWFPKPQ